MVTRNGVTRVKELRVKGVFGAPKFAQKNLFCFHWNIKSTGPYQVPTIFLKRNTA